MCELMNNIDCFNFESNLKNETITERDIEKYKTYYDKHMISIKRWNSANKEKRMTYHKEYYHASLKLNDAYKESLKTDHRKQIVSESYFRNKERNKIKQLELNGPPAPRGRPRKLINIIVSTTDNNIVLSQNEII
jgi:hypothetical protein